VDGDERMHLLVPGIDALTHGDKLDAGEVQLLKGSTHPWYFAPSG
jgi:hypothetical protein